MAVPIAQHKKDIQETIGHLRCSKHGKTPKCIPTVICEGENSSAYIVEACYPEFSQILRPYML